MQYKIIEADDIKSLTIFVNNAIKDGWVPTGGISLMRFSWENRQQGYVGDSTWYGQAMLKQEF